MAKRLKTKTHKTVRILLSMLIIITAIVVVDMKTNFSNTIMNAIRTRNRSIQYKYYYR